MHTKEHPEDLKASVSRLERVAKTIQSELAQELGYRSRMTEPAEIAAANKRIEALDKNLIRTQEALTVARDRLARVQAGEAA